MITYAEYLRSMGASDDDVKVLDTAVARKAFEAQQSAITAANAARDEANGKVTATKEWFDNVQTPEWNGLQNEVIVAKAEVARLQSALRTAEDRGLLSLSKDLGINIDGAAPVAAAAAATTPAGFDPSKYITMEDAKKMAMQERSAILIAQDIAAEHAVLFPGQRLNFSQLGQDALVAKKSVQQFWEDKYKVPEARAAAEKARQDEHDKKMREEGAKAERERQAVLHGSNPDLQTPRSSTSPFTVRKAENGGNLDQPWAGGRSEDGLSNDRVRRALEKQRLREAGQPVQ